MAETLVWLALGAFAVTVLAFLWMAVLFLKARARPFESEAEVSRIAAELERQKTAASLREASLCEKLKDKEAECQRVIAEKTASCDRLLEAERQAKVEALAARDRACEAALAEKDAACARLLDEKEAALKRKEADLARQLADRDAQQEKVLREKNAEIERFFGEKEKTFEEVVRTLREQFANLAAQTLKDQSADLTKSSSQHLEAVLKPLREQVELLKTATEKTQTEHANLAEVIGKDVGRIGDMARELAGVSAALSSNISFQGRKGEEILAEKLRQAGLEEGVNFFLQKGIATDRPDAQVCDTENRWLIIDSKVVLTAYFQSVEATDETTRKQKLADHVRSIREKIDKLAQKNYPKVFANEHPDRNYLPVTAMFVGYEAPLLEALKAEPSLWRRAADGNVILVTPLTLLAYLRLVYLAWQHEKEARNQQEIVSTARELLKRMNDFLITFEALGKSLTGAQDAYEKSKSVLVDSPRAQTIAKAANKLIDLHVRLEGRRGKRLEKAACLTAADEEPASLPDGVSGE